MSLEVNTSKKVESPDQVKELGKSASETIAGLRDSHAGSALHKTTNKNSESFTNEKFRKAEDILDFGVPAKAETSEVEGSKPKAFGKEGEAGEERQREKSSGDSDRKPKTGKGTDRAPAEGDATSNSDSSKSESPQTRNADGDHGPREDKTDPKDDQSGDLKGGDKKGRRQKKGWKSSGDDIKNAETPELTSKSKGGFADHMKGLEELLK